MLYQLPTGKVISLTIDEYLNLTDQDIQFLISVNAGEYANSPWVGSSIRNKSSISKDVVTNEMDYTDPDEDKSHGDNPNLDEISLDDIGDIPDPDSLD
jgi:hypothetical protein